MRIQEKIKNKIAILNISGNMMGGRENYDLNYKIKNLIADGIKDVVIDLHQVKWMNSPGLGILLSCRALLLQANGNLRIANATDKVKNMLIITHLVKHLGNYESVQRAMASIAKQKIN